MLSIRDIHSPHFVERIKRIKFLLTQANFWKKNKVALGCYVAAFLVLIIFHVTIMAPVIDKRNDVKMRIDQEKTVIAKYRKKLDDSTILKDRLSNSQRELDSLKSKLFPSSDSYQLTTKLEEYLSSGEGKKDIAIKSYQIVSTKEYGLYQEVQYNFALDANIYGLFQFLSWLNGFASSITVSDFNLRYAPRNDFDLIVNVNLKVLMQKKG